MERLCQTYDNCAEEIGGAAIARANGKHVPTPLLPICHTTQIAHIEIVVDSAGNWVPHNARTLEKDEGVTIVPCTENSAGRTSGLEPHPLFDKLQYVAGDYMAFGGAPKRFGYPMYMEKLRDWCVSPFSHPVVCAVLTYLEKGNLIADLVHEGILVCGEEGTLLGQCPENQEKPRIFKLLEDQFQAFVRFSVLERDKGILRLYEDEEIRERYISYQAALGGETDVCYVRGQPLPRAGTAPAKIRNSGDKAKLISSNDSNSNEFTYKGRVAESWQAVSISFEAMQKSHNALKWLISKQGWRNGDQVVLAWGFEDKPIPRFMDMDGRDLFDAVVEMDWWVANPDLGADTFADYATSVRKALDGWGKELKKNQNISVMVLDSTNGMIGRLSIPYYRELNGGEFIGRLNYWYTTCAWPIEKVKKNVDSKSERIRFTGAPAPLDIVHAAYGSGVGDKLKKAAVERLLPCIIDSAPLPRDLVALAARRAGNPFSAPDDEWRSNLSITCALIRKQRNDDGRNRWGGNFRDTENYKEVYPMALDPNNHERAYLFGRLLAYAEQAESLALYKSGEKRQTNAVRLMHQFSKRPVSTWRLLDEQLVYYYGKLEDRGGWFKSQIDAVMALFDRLEFDDKPLDDVYLLGYHSQLAELRPKKDDKTKNNITDGD